MNRWTALLFVSLMVAPTSAVASPWTLPQDDLSLVLGFDYSQADSEYLSDGDQQDFPLDGFFTSSTLRLGLRYGFTDNFEGSAQMAYKTVGYESQPLINPGIDPTAFPDRGAATDAILDFSEVRTGPADVNLAGRYNFMRGLVMLTGEVGAKLPTGYEEPQGTLDSDTGEVIDDVALGDGQTDLSGAILLGVFVPQTRSFVRLDLGYRHRLSAPGDQVFERFKFGQFVGDHVVLFAGVNGDFTIFEGEPVGTTVIARDPSLAPAEYDDPEEDLRPEPLFLDKDNLTADGGVLFVMGDYEMSFSYSQTLLGTNQAAIRTFSASAAIRLDGVTGR